MENDGEQRESGSPSAQNVDIKRTFDYWNYHPCGCSPPLQIKNPLVLLEGFNECIPKKHPFPPLVEFWHYTT